MNYFIAESNFEVNGKLKQRMTNGDELTLQNREEFASLMEPLAGYPDESQESLEKASASEQMMGLPPDDPDFGGIGLGEATKSDPLLVWFQSAVFSFDSLAVGTAKPKRCDYFGVLIHYVRPERT